MESHVTSEQFAKIANGKQVKEFPNPRVKEIGEKRYYITDGIECEVKKMEDKSFPWYLGWTREDWDKEIKERFGEDNTDVYILTTKGEWFPTELIAGVVNHRFSMNTPLAEKTGWINGACMGSANQAFRGAKVNEAIKILNKNGYNFETVKF